MFEAQLRAQIMGRLNQPLQTQKSHAPGLVEDLFCHGYISRIVRMRFLTYLFRQASGNTAVPLRVTPCSFEKHQAVFSNRTMSRPSQRCATSAVPQIIDLETLTSVKARDILTGTILDHP